MSDVPSAPDRSAVIAALRGHASELRAFGIAHLFGSVARGDAERTSDVDSSNSTIQSSA